MACAVSSMQFFSTAKQDFLDGGVSCDILLLNIHFLIVAGLYQLHLPGYRFTRNVRPQNRKTDVKELLPIALTHEPKTNNILL